MITIKSLLYIKYYKCLLVYFLLKETIAHILLQI